MCVQQRLRSAFTLNRIFTVHSVDSQRSKASSERQGGHLFLCIVRAVSHSLNCYSKCPKISNTLFYTILAKFLLVMLLMLKILSGMANSVDPDQTAPSGAD